MANNTCEIIEVDFKDGSKIDKSVVVLDPVLARVRDEISPESFKVYKTIVDDWMKRNFEYQIEIENQKA